MITTFNLILAQRSAIAGVLFAPSTFKIAMIAELIENCNGCGAGGSWFRPPSTLYGTSILSACIIHDWSYSNGIVIEDKDEADRAFLNNMNRLITRDKNKWWKPTFLQRRRAKKYYFAVKHFGGEAFWAGKA